MKFPYIFLRGNYLPIIPVTLIAGDKTFKTNAIVDSGATFSLFHASIGRDIDIDVESGEKHVFQGASAKLVGYIHKIKMVIANKEIECRVAFSDELSTSFNLLGRQDIFDNFKVCFDESEKTVEFVPK
jgi:predicted aspartyl protease